MAWRHASTVKTHVPRIDGYTLDLIIDFVTCIVIPVLFMLKFGMLPQSVGCDHRLVRHADVSTVDVSNRPDDQ